MAAEININYFLWWHLNRFAWIDLPGVAYFEAESTAAKLVHQNQQIFPAELKLKLGPPQQKADQMVQQMALESGVEAEFLETQLGTLCKYLSDQLKQSSKVEIEPYGVLKISGDGIREFLPSEFNAHERFTGQGPLGLSPLQMMYQKSDVPSVPIVPLPTRKKDDLRWLYWLLAILWIVFLVLLFWPSGNHKPSKSMVPIMDTARQDSIVPSDTQLQITIPADLENDSLPVLEKEVVLTPENVEEVNQQIQGKTCVIIVGSFKKKYFSSRMKSRVGQDGFKVYTESYGDFTRVGIQFDCMVHDLQAMLQELKQKYHPEAWVLKH